MTREQLEARIEAIDHELRGMCPFLNRASRLNRERIELRIKLDELEAAERDAARLLRRQWDR